MAGTDALEYSGWEPVMGEQLGFSEAPFLGHTWPCFHMGGQGPLCLPVRTHTHFPASLQLSHLSEAPSPNMSHSEVGVGF